MSRERAAGPPHTSAPSEMQDGACAVSAPVLALRSRIATASMSNDAAYTCSPSGATASDQTRPSPTTDAQPFPGVAATQPANVSVPVVASRR